MHKKRNEQGTKDWEGNKGNKEKTGSLKVKGEYLGSLFFLDIGMKELLYQMKFRLKQTNNHKPSQIPSNSKVLILDLRNSKLLSLLQQTEKKNSLHTPNQSLETGLKKMCR